MKVSYQRELYRSRMCCELEEEESSYGYPLQMCLRNSIPGLLPCNAEPVDGRTYICWDITSRNSLKELSGEGFTLELLERVLRAVYTVMRELEGYLISSGYLVLLPEQIYLDASRKKVEFICDYGDEASFRIGIQKLAEYILAGIDHKDQEQMRLGYGLYRLAVQENFSREEFQRLLFGKKEQTESRDFRMSDPGRISGSDGARVKASSREKGKYAETTPEDAVAGELERQKILDSFFADDEEEKEKQGIREYLPLYILLAAVAVCGLEIFFYCRNGRHIHPGWLIFGLLLTAVCTGAACVGQYIKNRREGNPEELQRTKTTHENKISNTDSGRWKETMPEEPVGQSVPMFEKTVFSGAGGETMVLQDPRPCGAEESLAVLEPVNHSGGKLIIPAKGAVLGKLPEAADIILPSPAVSRIHARITLQEGKYFIQDLNSRNGTRVNGCSLAAQQPVQLEAQDEIGFADLSFRFLMENTACALHKISI